MINSTYIFPNREVNLKTIRDYTAVYYGGLFDVIKEYPEYFMDYVLADGEKIEVVSYKLYGSENYADIILMVNNEVFLWGMPYNGDIIYEQKEAMEKFLRSKLNVSSDNEDFNSIIDAYGEEVDEVNSQKRIYKVPRPDRMNNVLSIINTYRQENILG